MKTVVFIGSVILMLLVISISAFTVSEGEHAVVTRFGKPVKIIKAAGFNLKYPGFIDRVNRIDRRIHTFTTQPIQLLLGDKNPIVMTCYICWRVQDPLLFFQSIMTTDIAVQKLGDMVNSQLGNTLGDYSLNNIINTNLAEVKIVDLEKRIQKNTNMLAKKKYGIEVAQVGIRRIAYPKIVAEAVYNRMRSEREKEAMKFRAEGKEAATKIKAKADREVTEILAEAYKTSQILKGEGDRQALKIYSEAYGKDKEFFKFTKSMEVYKDILSQKSTLVLSTDSDLFRYFNNPDGKPAK